MAVTKVEYLERFLSAVDRVTSGHPGGIADDRWLVNNYSGEMLPLVDKYLASDDERVRAETVLLLSDVRERAVMGKVREMRQSDAERVRLACLGYLNAMQDDDDLVPHLFDILEHNTGNDFHKAAMRMASVAREEDIARLRKIYGQVAGDMRTDMKIVLDKVISRNPALAPKRDLILSVPVYPDEAAFERFLDSSMDYLDVRYRRNVFPGSSVSVGTFNNVARALSKMRTRMYNEYDNLRYYGADKTDRYNELTELIVWANKDLSGKEVVGVERRQSHVCPRCGTMMVSFKGIWMCPDCGEL